MANLTANQESFVQLMKKSDEHARRGFELLLATSGIEAFFDELNQAGFFNPERNPAPVTDEEPGYYRIPYWTALDYLGAVAKIAGERNDLDLTEKVLNVVRAVSSFREPDGSIRDNHYTFRKFAEILGLIPVASITINDINLIPDWLNSRFGAGTVGLALDEGPVSRLLESDSPDNWNKAALIIRHCTAIRWIDEKTVSGKNEKEPATLVDDYWLKELINHNSNALGAKIGKIASGIFLERLREVFGQGLRNYDSRLFRPAIEEHPQNHLWHGPENRLVEGLRDVLLSWIDHDPLSAKPAVEACLRDEMEIVRRIGLHVLDKRWAVLRDVYPSLLGPKLFRAGHLHELYNLLRGHFGEMDPNDKSSTIVEIRKITRPDTDQDPEAALKYTQRNWLSAVAGARYEPADAWFGKLMSDETLGPLKEHPDFHSYIEVHTGFGATPYQADELIAFAKDQSLVEKLNTFRESYEWRGPTTRTLVDTLEEAVMHSPRDFLPLLPSFMHAKYPFKYGLISGFKRLWEGPKEQYAQIDWDSFWPKLIAFSEEIIGIPDFWDEKADESENFITLTPKRSWIPSLIADFLLAGTRDEQKAYPEALLPRALEIIKELLKNSKAVTDPSDDAMSQAINSQKGRVLEALFSHAQRVCRLNDKVSETHDAAWIDLRPIFDNELTLCADANFEFSTLAGAYVVKFYYFDQEWLRTRINRIFPRDFPANCACALEGLAYAPALEPLYSLLVENGIIDMALRLDLKGRYGSNKLIERIALAYLWEDEDLDSPSFSYLFDSDRENALIVTSAYFSSVRGQELSDSMVRRILAFWDRCIEWSKTVPDPPKGLLSTLSLLSCYLTSIGKAEFALLKAVAPYVQTNHNYDRFIEELHRLIEVNPTEVCAVLEIIFANYTPDFDFQDKLKLLLDKLANAGKRSEVISLTERLRNLPGIRQLYGRLISETRS